MNNIDFNQEGGFRLSTDIMAAVQASYTLFNALGWIAGDLAIIHGCEKTGSTVSDGYVFINGELLPFKGGNIGTNVIIQQLVKSYPFQNGLIKPVIYERFATFGTADTVYPWGSFKRIFATKDIQAFKDNHNTRITELEGKTYFYPGMIIRYDQPLEVPPPPGWIDWIPEDEQGRVWACRSISDGDFALGNKIGTKSHTLTKQELPNIDINMQIVHPYEGTVTGGGFAGGGNPWHQKNITIPLGGSGQSHNNIQPTVAVRYIRYVGFNEEEEES